MPISETDIHTTLCALLQSIAPETDPSTLKGDLDIRENLGIDSFDFLNLMIGLNDSFGIDIPEADYGKLDTVNNITRYIIKNVI
ncbi:MAG: hypothetical protein OHK0012_22990 [Synechococcales cyanobacterium]